MLARHPQHLKAFSYLGPYRYSLRFCTIHRQRVFTRAGTVDLVKTQIQRSATEHRFSVIAYCFMPDHLHLLVEGETDRSDCRCFIARTKQYSGYSFTREFNTRLWQRYGYERVLRPDETNPHVARYILENPVRAGLVARIEDYLFVGSLKYSLPQLVEWAYADSNSQQSG